MKLSIITVTYNAELTLLRTIQSVVNQMDKRYEYILIDGASRDATVDVAKKSGAFSIIISERDGGLYDAMNKGLKYATGDYVCFLNAGDKFHDNKVVNTILSIAEKNDMPDVVYGETDIVDSEGNFLYHRRLKAPKNLTWRSFEKGMLVCHQAFIMKRIKSPMYDLQYCFSADYDWCIKCMKNADDLIFTNTILIDYLSEGVTTANRAASLKERFRIMVKNYGFIKVVFNHIGFAIRFLIAKINKQE